MKTVIEIRYNWRVIDGEDDYHYHKVGLFNVTEIIENEPTNGMQLWNFLVYFEDGHSERVFNINHVFYL
jgi:hypothetical protein